MMYIDEDMLNQIIDEMKGNNYTEEFNKNYTVSIEVHEERLDGSFNVHFDNFLEAVAFCDSHDDMASIRMIDNTSKRMHFGFSEIYEEDGSVELNLYRSADYLNALAEIK